MVFPCYFLIFLIYKSFYLLLPNNEYISLLKSVFLEFFNMGENLEEKTEKEERTLELYQMVLN